MIIGHEKQREFLNKIKRDGSRSLLFVGPELLGKKTVAFNFFSSIFEGRINRHPDFIFVEPSNNNIHIQQIRTLSQRISFKPVQSSCFGVIIDDAHLMNKDAQNCFLKTLEEPKSNAILILITDHPDYLLPTIISRCEKVKFYPVENKRIISYLKEKRIKEEEIEEITKIALGRPGQAVNFLNNPEEMKERKRILKEFIEMAQSPLEKRFNYVKKISEEENLREILIIWLSYLRERMISNKTKNLEKLRELINALQETIFLISSTNTSSKLALEALVVQF